MRMHFLVGSGGRAVIDAVELYPPIGLIIRTPDLVLQPADEACAVELANAVLEHGIHDPSYSPFSTPWTDADPLTVARSVFTNVLAARSVDPWMLKFVIRLHGKPIGVMDLRQHADVRDEVGTGSWLLRHTHGKGYGTQARAAVLKLAFEGLGVREARTAAYTYNSASLGVTRKLGYVHVETEDRVVRGEHAESHKFAVTRELWMNSPAARSLNPHITWTGLDAVKEYLRITEPSAIEQELT